MPLFTSNAHSSNDLFSLNYAHMSKERKKEMGAVLIKEIEKDISWYMHLQGLPAHFCFCFFFSPSLSYVCEMSFCPIKLHLSSWWTGTNVIYDISPPFPGRVVLKWFPGHKYPGDNNTTIRRRETAGMFPWRPYWSLSTRSMYSKRNLGQELDEGCKLPMTGSIQWNNAGCKHAFV